MKIAGLVGKPTSDNASPSWICSLCQVLSPHWSFLLQPPSSCQSCGGLPKSFSSSVLTSIVGQFPKVPSPRRTSSPLPTISHFHRNRGYQPRKALTVCLLEPGVPGGPGQPLLPWEMNKQTCISSYTAVTHFFFNLSLFAPGKQAGHPPPRELFSLWNAAFLPLVINPISLWVMRSCRTKC